MRGNTFTRSAISRPLLPKPGRGGSACSTPRVLAVGAWPDVSSCVGGGEYFGFIGTVESERGGSWAANGGRTDPGNEGWDGARGCFGFIATVAREDGGVRWGPGGGVVCTSD